MRPCAGHLTVSNCAEVHCFPTKTVSIEKITKQQQRKHNTLLH